MSVEAFEMIELETEERLEKALTALDHEFGRIRTGRAAPQMIDHVQVEVYGAPTPLRQIASVTVPEPTQLLIKPYDKNALHAIEKGLAAADLGMTPQNDGQVIRLNVPPLSEERRRQLAGQAKEATEKCKVSMRGARRDGIKAVETTGKEEKVGEDLVKQATEGMTDLLKAYEAKAEARLKEKTEAILEV